MQEIQRAAEYLQTVFPKAKPSIGIVCGSGLGGLASLLSESVSLHYSQIPHFSQSSVAGHEGRLVYGLLGKVVCVCMVGRFHCYEVCTFSY